MVNSIIGDPYLDELILLLVDDTTLISIKRLNRYYYQSISDEDFWKRRTLTQFREIIRYKPNDMSFKDYYQLGDQISTLDFSDREVWNRPCSFFGHTLVDNYIWDNNLNMLKVLAKQRLLPSQRGIDLSMRDRYFHIFSWLIRLGFYPTDKGISIAIKGKQWRVLDHLYSKDVTEQLILVEIEPS